ncbi:small ribosomal subunit protein uS2-like [Mirounga angustirostris]|uniref:small ribosomal subunit protein uS2-like n=1 Tax=Mirounga angustirostris TaxID=9716 RepID=UPI00313DC5BC
MSRALDVLQTKEEDVLTFPAAGTHLGGTNLDFQMEQYIYKRESDGICIINLKRTREKLLLAAHAMVAAKNLADVSILIQEYWPGAVLTFAAASGATPTAGHFTPGTFTTQTQAAFREPRLSPGLTTSLLQRRLMLTCLSSLWVTQTLLCATWTSPSLATTRELTQWAWEVPCMRGTISRGHPWGIMPDLYFYRDPEEIEKEGQVAAENSVTEEDFQGERTVPVPEFTAIQPEVTDWADGVQVHSVPIQQFPIEDWSARPGPRKTGLQLPLLRPQNGWEQP